MVFWLKKDLDAYFASHDHSLITHGERYKSNAAQAKDP